MALVRVADPRRGALPPAYLARRRAAFLKANAGARPIRGLAGPAFVTGIPDSDTCGVNPCGWTDIIGPSAACLSFVRCADPSDFSSWLAGKGDLVPSLAAQAGSDVSSTVNETFDAFFNRTLGGGPNPTSGVNWLVVGGILAAVLLVPRLLKA